MKFKKIIIGTLLALLLIIFGYFVGSVKYPDNYSIKEAASIIGNISQFLLVILGLFVFVQIKVAKESFKIQCERDAIAKSVDLANIFANQIIPKMNDYYLDLKSKNFISSARELPNFCMDDVELLDADSRKRCNEEFDFFNKNRESRGKCINVLNNFEAFAINFTNLLANEESLFTALSQAYCSFIEKNYAVISLSRKTKHDLYYVNMLDLYKQWSYKIKLSGLLVEKSSLDNRVDEISKMCDNKYVPRGSRN